MGNRKQEGEAREECTYFAINSKNSGTNADSVKQGTMSGFGNCLKEGNKDCAKENPFGDYTVCCYLWLCGEVARLPHFVLAGVQVKPLVLQHLNRNSIIILF